MGSFEERANTLPKIEVQSDGQFLVKIMNGNIQIANVVISITEIEYNLKDNSKNKVKMRADVIGF